MYKKRAIRKIASAFLTSAMVVTCAPVGGQVTADAAVVEQAQEARAKVQLGSAQREFAAGEYALPAALMKSTDITTASMAGSCIKDGKLTVNKDGTADITIGLQPVSVMGVSGWASDWKIYTGNLGGEKTGAAHTEDAQGNVDSITFRLPDNAMDGVYLEMYIEAMQSSQQAYLAFDFSAIGSEGTSQSKSGSARVEQFGGYDVHAAVSVQNGKITGLAVEGANFEGTYADINKTTLQKAIDVLQTSYIGRSATDARDIESVDAASSATYSSEAIQTAVLNALGLKRTEEAITLPTQKLEKGTYQVDIAFYTDNVKHSLVENDKAKATITVDDAGTMTLTTAVINGTEKEPLYFYELNGYYEGNRENGALKAASNVKKDDIDYADDVFGADEKVVTEVSFPLEGGFAETYRANASIYVPAMKNLTGEVGGVLFDQGRFSSDCFAKIYWDSLKKIQTKSIEDGTYTVQGDMYKVGYMVGLTDRSMADAAIGHQMQMTVKNGKATLTMDFQGLNISGLYGYLKTLRYYDTGYTTDQMGNPKGTLKDVTVQSLQKDSKGAVIADDLGRDYPDVVSFELIPEALEDGVVPMQVFVPIMESITPGSGNQDVYLKLDLDSMKKATVQKPATPSKVKAASAAYDKIKITWSAVKGAEGYEVYQYNSGTKKYSRIASLTGTSYTQKSLKTGQKYTYKVRAYKNTGGQKLYSTDSQTASATPILSSASGVKAKNTKTRTATVSWKKVSGASGYEVYRSTKVTKGFKRAGILKKNSTVKYADKKLDKGKTYYYKIKAYRTVGGKKVYASYSKTAKIKIKK